MRCHIQNALLVFFVLIYACVNSYGAPLSHEPPKHEKVGKDGLVCYGCKTLIGVMKDRLSKNETWQLLKRKLQKDCMILSSNNTQLCSSVVPVLMDFLHSVLTLNSSAICQQLTLCPKSEFESTSLKSPLSESVMGIVSHAYYDVGKLNGLQCTFCKFLAGAIDKYLLTKVDSVANYVQDVCKKLPEPASQDCTQFISALNLTKTIPLVITTVLNPEDVCEIAGACSPTLSPEDVASRRTVSAVSMLLKQHLPLSQVDKMNKNLKMKKKSFSKVL